MRIEKIGIYWQDDRGNRSSIEDETKAREALASNENCTDCTDCYNCVECENRCACY